jgi:Tol biopolymer transport system component
VQRYRFLFLALLALSGPTAGQSPASRLSRPVEYWNPDWSPDGRTLVFESTLGGKYAIYTIRADGSGLARLTADTATNGQPRWSPDGRRIVFSSDRAGHGDLYLMNADGSGVARLTSMGGGSYYQASFSPDGKWIAFQGRPDVREVCDRVYVIASDGTGLRQLTDSSYGAEGPRWTSDGQAITFRQLPYPKRLWAEMGDDDMDVAKRGERLMSVRRDGTGLMPAASSPRRASEAPVPAEAQLSPDAGTFAYTKSVEGFAGLYVYDVATKLERLVTGGAGAGPLGYLRIATLTAGTDTIDTYESPRGSQQIRRGNGAWVIQATRRVGARRWELSSTWHDSAGRVTARQSVRTARGSLATDLETVRAVGDSASLLMTSDRVTGWVVPQGQPPRLFDAPSAGERYAGEIVAAAIAKSHPAIGSVFLAPSGAVYGANPVELRVDTTRVVRRDTLYRASTPIPVLVLERQSGGQLWVEERSGIEVLSRGNAGPERWWWHIRRGVRPPG